MTERRSSPIPLSSLARPGPARRAPSRRRGRRRPGRPVRRDRPRAARRAGRAARRCRPHRRGLARHLLRQADAGDPRPPRRRATHASRRASPGRSARSSSATSSSIAFDLLPEDGHKMPAFINLQQYYLEQFLVERAAELDADRHALAQQGRPASSRRNDGATLTHRDAGRPLSARRRLGDRRRRRALDAAAARSASLRGRGVRGPLPDRRREDGRRAFRPSAGSGSTRRSTTAARRSCTSSRTTSGASTCSSARTPIASEEQQPERVVPRLRQMLGARPTFALEWVSVYTFQCRRLERFVHGRVIFAGDAAHQVSPFGARGGNSRHPGRREPRLEAGARRSRARRPARLIDSYDVERSAAADENIGHSTRSTDFIAPRSRAGAALPRRGAGARPRHGLRASAWSIPAASRRPAPIETPLSTPDRGPVGRQRAARRAGARRAASRPRRRPVWLLDALGGEETLLRRGRRTAAAPPGVHDASSSARISSTADGSLRRSASTRRRARPTSSAPTSISPRAGGSTPTRSRRRARQAAARPFGLRRCAEP